MEDHLVGVITDVLDSLDSLTVWLFSSFIVVLLALFSSKDEVTIAGFTVKKADAGSVLLITLCGLTFTILKLLNMLDHTYGRLEVLAATTGNDEAAQAMMSHANLVLQTHTWVFNPFAETSTLMGPVMDNVGFPMLIVMWWFGFGLSLASVVGFPNRVGVLNRILAGVYLLLGLGCMGEIQLLISRISVDSSKSWVQVIGIVAGGLIYLFITVMIKRRAGSVSPSQPPSVKAV